MQLTVPFFPWEGYSKTLLSANEKRYRKPWALALKGFFVAFFIHRNANWTKWMRSIYEFSPHSQIMHRSNPIIIYTVISSKCLKFYFWKKKVDKSFLVQDLQINFQDILKTKHFRKKTKTVIHIKKWHKMGICYLYTKLSTLSTNEKTKFFLIYIIWLEQAFCEVVIKNEKFCILCRGL